MTTKNPGPQAQPRRIAKPLDLSSAVVKTKKMTGPKMVIRRNSYTGDCTALSSRFLTDLAAELGDISVKPNAVAVSALTTEGEAETEDLGDIAMVPVQEKSVSTLAVKWDADNSARIDLAKLFATRRFSIPQGQTAHIPMSVEEVEGLGKAIIVHFTQAWFAEIAPTGKRGKGKQPA